MANLIRCESCQGKKRMLCLGGIIRECPACRGIGWIEDEDKALESALAEKMDKSETRKKAGRKKKLVNEEIALDV